MLGYLGGGTRTHLHLDTVQTPIEHNHPSHIAQASSGQLLLLPTTSFQSERSPEPSECVIAKEQLDAKLHIFKHHDAQMQHVDSIKSSSYGLAILNLNRILRPTSIP